MNETRLRKKRVLAVGSAGGHWIQLQRLRHAFEGSDLKWLTTTWQAPTVAGEQIYVVDDASSWQKLRLIRMFLQVARVVLRLRPEIVVTTGAAPGLAAIFFGRLLGARTVWIDSIANSESLSASGVLARRWADVWLTQWAHLEKPDGPRYWGSVL
jgi:UDP-N-acetylglucosamine:LPS N-acetylglucosamine transferase